MKNSLKKSLSIIGKVIAGLLIILSGFLLFVQLSGRPVYDLDRPAELENWQADRSPENVARGAKIAMTSCQVCHLGKDGKLSGKLMQDMEEMGTIYSANLTQHPEYGLGKWTDGQLKYFLRTSINKDGELVPPYMPPLNRMADEDLNALIAFLRSDEPMVRASDFDAGQSRENLLVKLLNRLVFKPLPYPETPILRPDTADPIALGAYLANDLANCYACHSKNFSTNSHTDPASSEGFYGGGNELLNLEGEIVTSANLTFHEEGIAHYDETAFIRAVKWGQRPDGTTLVYPMLPFTMLSDDEVKHIYAYLKTLPPLATEGETP